MTLRLSSAASSGFTLAVDLGLRGTIRYILIEQKEAPQFLPKMERCNARTMEIYRRLRLARQDPHTGLKSPVPMNVFVVLALNEPPLLRLPYPSVDAALAIIAATDGAHALEPYQLISRTGARAATEEGQPDRYQTCTVCYGTKYLVPCPGQRRRGSGQTGGRATTIRGAYYVGCDGGGTRKKTSRKQLGVTAWGEGNISQLRQALLSLRSTLQSDSDWRETVPERVAIIMWQMARLRSLIMQIRPGIGHCIQRSRGTRT